MKEIIDESVYLRVTTPLAIFNGYANIPIHILENAADRGTRVHYYCNLYANTMLFEEIDENCLPYVQAFIKWFDEHVESVAFTEKRLFCDEYMIQGQPDLVCRIKTQQYQYGYVLVDIKTSSKYSKTWDLQTAAYKSLCERNNFDIQERMIVHLHKDATFDVIEYKDHELEGKYLEQLSIYRACLKAYRYFF